MESISLFTPINYARKNSCSEEMISTLSHYFYLGGKQATVIQGDEVQLENRNVSCIAVALKVASYILLLPLALILFTLHLCLRSQHHFTIIKKEDILETLTQSAPREDKAFLIDFSQVTPANMFKIFDKNSNIRTYGEAGISDTIRYDESSKFTHGFPFTYILRVVYRERDANGYPKEVNYMFMMKEDGKVESYGKVFENFSLYLEYQSKYCHFDGKKWLPFSHFDFHSIPKGYDHQILRKKFSSIPPSCSC